MLTFVIPGVQPPLIIWGIGRFFSDTFCSDLNLEGYCLAQECHFRLQAEENHRLDHFVISRDAAMCAHKQQRCQEHYPLPFAWADSLTVFFFVCLWPPPATLGLCRSDLLCTEPRNYGAFEHAYAKQTVKPQLPYARNKTSSLAEFD